MAWAIDSPVASVSKVYTAATVLELVADGMVALDTDVTRLVAGLSLGDADAPAITLRHLLTHTPGLDERNLDRYLPLAEADASPRNYLLDTMPSSVRKRFDLVGFDPRGVAASSPALWCNSDADNDRLRADPDILDLFTDYWAYVFIVEAAVVARRRVA